MALFAIEIFFWTLKLFAGRQFPLFLIKFAFNWTGDFVSTFYRLIGIHLFRRKCHANQKKSFLFVSRRVCNNIQDRVIIRLPFLSVVLSKFNSNFGKSFSGVENAKMIKSLLREIRRSCNFQVPTLAKFHLNKKLRLTKKHQKFHFLLFLLRGNLNFSD